MGKMVDLREGYRVVGQIDVDTVKMHDEALPTSRLLAGSDDHGAYAEYTQSCTLDDGREATVVYILEDEHVQDADGDVMEDESSYDWDAALNRIVLD